MKSMDYYFVDVFAETKYAGNQLAVFRDAHGLSDETMLAIAREINFSETTFILSDKERNGGFDVRIFTPGGEVPFAGHPTLGTAYVIKEHILNRRVEHINLNLEVGQIPVNLIYSGDVLAELWMKQNSPTFGRILEPSEVAPIIGVAEADFDTRFPIEEVSTGLPFFMVPLTNLAAVRAARVDLSKYYDFVKKYNPDPGQPAADHVISSGLFIFSPETYHEPNHLNARMFDDYYGVPEDPATGSANGCLLAYLLKHDYFGGKTLDLRVEQGYEMKRPSLIFIKGKMLGQEHFEIFVGGQVQRVARGDWPV